MLPFLYCVHLFALAVLQQNMFSLRTSAILLGCMSRQNAASKRCQHSFRCEDGILILGQLLRLSDVCLLALAALHRNMFSP